MSEVGVAEVAYRKDHVAWHKRWGRGFGTFQGLASSKLSMDEVPYKRC